MMIIYLVVGVQQARSHNKKLAGPIIMNTCNGSLQHSQKTSNQRQQTDLNDIYADPSISIPPIPILPKDT